MSDLLLIPGPIMVSSAVEEAASIQSLAHTSPEFVKIFQGALQKLRTVFQTSNAGDQPIVISGSGTLGWDIVGNNLLKSGDSALTISTGFFSDSFAECLKTYGADVDVLKSEPGKVVALDKIESQLKSKKYQLITLTHVDTSTATLLDLPSITSLVKKVSPETFIIVDGVCSIGCEEFKFSEWSVDFVLTASQKALSCPSGLSVCLISERALSYALSNESTHGFYANLKKWIPIMKAYEAGVGQYFATPSIQLVNALNVSLGEILSYGLEARIAKNKKTSDQFKNNLKQLGLTLVSEDSNSAHGLTAVYVDQPGKVISSLKSKGIVIAGGILPGIKDKYIRIGHMGISAIDDNLHHIDKVFEAIKESI